jgi:hypothetical protein
LTTPTLGVATATSLQGIIGNVTPAAGAFTTLTTSSTVTLNGGTANGVTYLDGSKVLTSGSALVFDGSNLGLGVTPSAWQTASGSRAIQFTGSGVYGYRDTNLMLTQNAYLNTSGDWTYYASSIAPAYYTIGSGSHQWYRAASGTAGNAITFSESMRIDSSGNLLVALTSQVGSGTICTVNSATKNGIVVKDSASGSALYSGLDNSNSSVFIVQGSGNVQNANNSYGAISDIKLKENIVDATPKLADLMQVKVRTYNLIGETTKQIGVVAQELETVFPAMVDESSDRDAEGNDLGTTTKSVKYSVFVPMLIKAMQELKADFDAYKASHP